MSRYYEMGVEISGYNRDKEPQIKQAAEEQWPFQDWWPSDEGGMYTSAESTLCGGESEEQFTERLSVAVWRANGSYCEVLVKATYLEDLPYELHALDEDDYSRLMTTMGESHE
jgi:hypothetical protein